MQQAFKGYEKQENTPEERDALLTARKVANLYSQAIETSKNMYANGSSAKDIVEVNENVGQTASTSEKIAENITNTSKVLRNYPKMGLR